MSPSQASMGRSSFELTAMMSKGKTRQPRNIWIRHLYVRGSKVIKSQVERHPTRKRVAQEPPLFAFSYSQRANRIPLTDPRDDWNGHEGPPGVYQSLFATPPRAQEIPTHESSNDSVISVQHKDDIHCDVVRLCIALQAPGVPRVRIQVWSL